MREASNVLSGVEAAELVALAIVAVALWAKRRDDTRAWIAATFALLGLVVTVGLVLPTNPHDLLERIVQRFLVAAILLFPYCLYRFTATFLPPSRRLRLGFDALTVAVIAWGFAVPHYPAPGEHRSMLFVAFIAAVLVQWTLLSFWVAATLWRAGRLQPTVARRRMRTLSAGAAGLAIALLAAGTSNSSQTSGRQLAVGVLVIAVCPMFLVGVAPPSPLLVFWRQADQLAMRQAVAGLMLAVTPQDIATNLLPRMSEFIGGRGAALILSDGTVAGVYRLSDAEVSRLRERASEHHYIDGVTSDGEALWLPLSSGWLVVATSVFMPFFSQDESSVLRSTGALVDMALSRVALLQRDREHVLAMRDFVAIASHDLRTPTTAIAGFTTLLATRWDSLSDDEKRQMVSTVQRQSQHLGALVEDLLTTSRIDAAAVSTNPRVLQVAALVEEVVRDVLPAAAVDIPAGLEVYADPDHFRRIVINYLRNATVYGRPPYTVVARAGNGAVDLMVVDNGDGVPREFEPRLFEKFARADRTASKASGGTGLGLSIVAGLASAAGGAAWHRAHQPHGSEFGVTLPVPLPRQSKAVTGQEPRETPWTSAESSSSSKTTWTSAG